MTRTGPFTEGEPEPRSVRTGPRSQGGSGPHAPRTAPRPHLFLIRRNVTEFAGKV